MTQLGKCSFLIAALSIRKIVRENGVSKDASVYLKSTNNSEQKIQVRAEYLETKNTKILKREDC